MPYLVSSIIAIVAALIILMTRYEADDSAITAEIERAKVHFENEVISFKSVREYIATLRNYV